MEIFKAIVPILVVLLTAVLSGYLIPRLTRGWQDHQKELELKTSLIEEVNRAVVQIVLAIQLAERGAIPQKEYDDAYRNWEIHRAVLAAKMRAYYRTTEIADEFEALFDAITDLYALGGISHTEYWSSQIEKLRLYFGDAATDWTKLKNQQLRASDRSEWLRSWWNLRQATLVRKDALIQRLLTESTRLLATKRS